jgi:FKBP-type peptidyl-prolyl cis-trans isomerase 2
MRAALLILLSLLVPALLLGCAAGNPPVGNSNSSPNGGDIMKNQTNGTLVVAKGDTVQVDYIGALENGTVFDTSIASEAKKAGLPLREKYDFLEFTVGAGQMIKGFDDAVVGMKEGEEKIVKIAPADAYGEWDASRVISIPVDRIDNSSNIKVGSELYAQNGAVGKVIDITNGTAKIDFNHELAGKNLVFTIRMVKIFKK